MHHDEPDRALMAQGVARTLEGLSRADPAQVRCGLGAGGWLWPGDDALLLPRGEHVALVGEALGRAAAPVPYSPLVRAAALLDEVEFSDRDRLREALAAGEVLLAFVPAPVGSEASLAVDAAPRRALLGALPASVPDGGSLVYLPASAEVPMRPVRTLDGHQGAWIESSALLSGGQVLARGETALRLLQEATDWALLASCAAVSGMLQWLDRQTVDYIKTRRQFGVAVGTFQAVQHRAVDLHIAAQELRALLWASAPHMGSAGQSLVVARLKVKCARSARLCAQAAVQLHGAMGLTHELPVGRVVLAIEAELARHASAGACLALLQHALLSPPLEAA